MRHFKKSVIKNNKWTKTCKAIKELLDILTCSKCKKSLHNSQQFLICGHFSCISCVNNDSTTCIECQSSYKSEDIVKDDTINKIVQACCVIAQEVGFQPNTKCLEKRLVETPTSEETYNSSEEFVQSRSTGKTLTQLQRKSALEKRKSHIDLTSNKYSKKPKLEKPAQTLRIPKNINKRNHLGETKLLEECKRNHTENVKSLLDAGADPNIGCNAKWTPLQESVDFGFYEIVEILLKGKADVNQLGFEGRTALHEAVENDDVKMVELLLKHGAKRNICDATGKKPIGKSKKVKMLLNCDAKKSVPIKEENLTINSQYCHEASSSSNDVSCSQDSKTEPNININSQECEETEDYNYYCERNSNNLTISHSQSSGNYKASCSHVTVNSKNNFYKSCNNETSNSCPDSEEIIDVIN